MESHCYISKKTMIMEMNEKLNWLTHSFIELIEKLSAEDKGSWGVMNAQQMVEHMSYSVRQANGKDKRKLLTPMENLERMRTFMLSDKPFKENTKNSELPAVPYPVRQSSMADAIAELKKEMDDFISYYKLNPGGKLMNPFFGEMNFDEWVHLLHKHATHHAKQFRLVE